MKAASRQQMQMDVEDRLTCFAIRVEHRPVAAIGVAVFPGDLRSRAMHGPNEAVVVRRQIVQRGDVSSRDDQHMQRRLRVDVFDRDQLIVLMHELSRNLAADDLAEETVGLSRSITAVRGMPCKSARTRSRRSEGRAVTSCRTSFS